MLYPMFRLEGKVGAKYVLARGRSVILFHWSFVVVRIGCIDITVILLLHS